RRVSFLDIIAVFLQTLRERTLAALGGVPERVVLGRPVYFVDGDPLRDAQAQASLQAAAHAAGWGEVSFQFEPMAAALDYERQLSRETLVLVADIGGGTSDFTLVRLGPDRVHPRNRAQDVLATAGVHIGGTDFDQRLSLANAMPLLGYRHTGPGGREVPSRTYFDLATWHLIQWLYQPRALTQVQSLRTNFKDPVLFQRLLRVLTEQLGHHIAHEVEQAKIRCSAQQADTAIDLSVLEAGLAAPLATEVLSAQLDPLLEQVVGCAQSCLQTAGVSAGDLGAVYLTGGSSALQPFQTALQAAFPGVGLVTGDLLGSVATGLACTRG
ncbi:MAG: Chaperone protein DnaK, partial [Pseudomonadota bacterium]